MIHHVSIAAREPKRAASVLAELMKGRVFPFPGRIADAFIAASGDEHGTMIEVFPEQIALQPGEDGAPVRATNCATPASDYTPFHLPLSIRDHHTIRSKSYAKARRHKPPRPIALTKRPVAVQVASPYDEYSRSSDSRPLGRRQRSDTDHKPASSRISGRCRTSGPLCWSKRGARALAYDFEQIVW